MNSLTITISLLVIVVTYIIYIASRRIYKSRQKYKNGRIPYLGLQLPKCFEFISGKSSIVDLDAKICVEAESKNTPVIACFDVVFCCNVVFITDVDLLRHIFVKDFDHFINHRPMTTTKVANRHFRKMLFSIENDPWKGTRAKLSPAFTTGRIKQMSEILKKSSEDMISYLKKDIGYPARSSGDINFSQMIVKFGVDVIASSAFGIDSQAWNVKEGELSKFEEMGRRLGFRLSGVALVKFLMTTFAPSVMDLLNIDALDHTSQSYFENVIKTVAKHRRETGSRRNDFLQLMLDIQQGLLKADEESEQVMNGSVESNSKQSISTEASSGVAFDDDDLVAHGLTFFFAGLEAVASTVLFTFYALATNPKVQDKLYKEIVSVLEKHGGNLRYEAIQDMTYLDMVINESLRFYPGSPRTERSCNKDYNVPGTDMVIRKGDSVIIPIYWIHHHPKYFPNPEQFIPERFSSEGKTGRSPYAYLPFGHGPRNCIAMRFALIELKMVVAHLVHSFELTPCSRTAVPMEFGRNMNLKPKHDLWMNIKVREN